MPQQPPIPGLPDDALRRWEGDLLAIGGRDDLLDLDERSPLLLDLGTTHPSGLAAFLAGRETTLSTLFREPSTLIGALRRARAIRVASGRLTDDLGLPGSRLATGLLTWQPPDDPAVTAPTVLRPLALVPRGGSDFELVPDGDPYLNPALVRLLAGTAALQGVSPDDPRAVATALERLEGARVHDRTFVGAFAAVGPGLVADLRARGAALAMHPLVRRLVAGADDVGALPPPATGARSHRSARLDPSQQAVLDAVVAGADVRVEAAPGTGATEVVAALVEQAHAAGRSLLVVAPHQADLDELRDRLDEGVPTLDVTAAVTARTELHRPQHPWGRSRLDVLRRLVELGAAPEGGTRAGDELGARTLRALASDRARSQAAELMVQAGEVDAYEQVARTSPWAGADLTTPEAATEALDAVRRLHADDLPAARELLGRTSAETGLAPARRVTDWGRQLDLLMSVRDTLDVFTPAVYERAHPELIQATGTTRWRRANGVEMSLLERRRWRQEGERLVRPGMRVADLHSALVRARTEIDEWTALSGDTRAPSVPADLAAADAAQRAVLGHLQVLDPVLAGTAEGGPLDEVELDALDTRLAVLSAAGEDLQVLPKRNGLLADLDSLGLTALVDRLALEGADRAQVADELEIAWHRGVLDEMDASDSGWDTSPDTPADVAGAPGTRLRSVTALAVPALGDEVVDTLVVLGAHRTGEAEGVLAVVRARQVIVVGDPGGLPPVAIDLGAGDAGGAAERTTRRSLLEATQGRLPTLVLERSHRRPRALVEVLPGDRVLSSVPAAQDVGPVLDHVADGTVPVTAEATEDPPQAEVARVVALVGQHVREHPTTSLAVLTVTRTEALAVADVLRLALREDPALARWVSREAPEPFVVTDLWNADDSVRDHVVLAVGTGRTPHGRVLHRFGPLDEVAGDRLLRVGTSRARQRLTVVSSVLASDLDPDKVSTDGARALHALLDAAAWSDETVERGDPTAPHTDPLLVRFVEALRAAGREVIVPDPGPATGWAAPDFVVTAPDGPRTAVLWDGTPVLGDDPAATNELVREQRHLATVLTRFGWRVLHLGAEQLARDLDGAVARTLGR